MICFLLVFLCWISDVFSHPLACSWFHAVLLSAGFSSMVWAPACVMKMVNGRFLQEIKAHRVRQREGRLEREWERFCRRTGELLCFLAHSIIMWHQSPRLCYSTFPEIQYMWRAKIIQQKWQTLQLFPISWPCHFVAALEDMHSLWGK